MQLSGTLRSTMLQRDSSRCEQTPVRTKKPAKRSRRRAFTLIEVLMVVTTLAIIAGVVIPQVGSVIDDARHATMLAQLSELTLAVERYQIDHEGRAPDLMTDRSLPQLINHTNIQGAVGTTSSYPLGPYVRNRMPVNPLNGTSDVFRSNSAPPTNLTSRVGWVYHPETGQIWAGLYQGVVPNGATSLPGN
ncbi:Type II secretion system protein G precursor [Anatilimnocola aggregata]|uniref:Type II secretion system protein G n=1 Tax=Anatilimnocola aggregata TaxID=2528021 RepID=A0A517Y4V7_9BACT|nr:prepilin-type N-terminal cleavage/methylation domain-containing protein [Anatilimnocola aggregata]QDU25220.1 Type II secretion system protein G precursor [Anatilimnocola aggregata]